MVGEALLVREDRAQGTCGSLRFDRAMQMGGQIGRGEMHAAVGAVRAWRYRGGIGGPHRRGGGHCRQQSGRFAVRPCQHLGFLAGKAQALERGNVRPLLRRQHALGHAQVGQGLHLGQALQHRAARVGGLLGVLGRGDIAHGQAGVVMGRADQAVEVRFDGPHRPAHSVRPGESCAGSSQDADSIEATG